MELSRIQCHSGQSSSIVRNAAALLPSAQKKEQKITFGDRAGIVTCWRLKNPKEPQQVFASKPGEREVTALALGGPRLHKDKIFVAFGNTIVGFKKNGKDFLTFRSGLNEDIRNMFVDNATIWTCGDYILNRFDNCVDAGFFMSNDRINHFTIEFDLQQPPNLVAILGCQDSCVRVVSGQDVLSELMVNAPVMFVISYPTAGSYYAAENHLDPECYRSVRRIIFGTSRGQIGQILMDQNGLLIKQDCLIDLKAGAVNCIAYGDLEKLDCYDIVVGHDCGTISLCNWEDGTEGSTLVLSAKVKISESISSIHIGNIISTSSKSIVAIGYSGSINIFNLKPLVQSLKSDEQVPKAGLLKRASSSVGSILQPPSQPISDEIAELRAQLDELTKQLNQKRAAYQQQSAELVAVETQFHVNSSFRLDPDSASCILSIEIEMPLDVCILCSNVPLMITQSSAIVNSLTSENENSQSGLLATLRCSESCNKITAQIKTIEGPSGELSICVIPKLYPKTCQTIVIPIKPLSLHEKVPLAPSWTHPLNKIKFTGSFTFSQIHSWIASCLPEMPVHSAQNSGYLIFRNSFLDSHLICEYEKGSATFTSDSCSTISIVKEVITGEATNDKVQLTMNLETNDGAVVSLIERIRPKVERLTNLSKKFDKLAALKEIYTQEGEDCMKFLSPEYCDILTNAESIQREVESTPQHLDFLRKVLSELYLDIHKLRGKSAKGSLSELEQIMQKFDYDAVIQIFTNIL